LALARATVLEMPRILAARSGSGKRSGALLKRSLGDPDFHS
jgi:hypothetical protein